MTRLGFVAWVAALTLWASHASAQVVASAAPADECPATAASDIHAAVQSAVVAVESVGEDGTGIVVRSNRYVATAFSLVEIGRPVRVRFGDGTTIPARVVAHDRDLAILELDRDGPASPISLARDTGVAIGAPLFLVGPPTHREPGHDDDPPAFGTAIARGFVSALNERFVGTDARSPDRGIGAPVFRCDRALVGLVRRRNDAGTTVVRTAQIASLLETLGRDRTYRGRIAPTFTEGFVTQFDPSGLALFGISAGAGVNFFDRFTFTLRASALLGGRPTQGPVFSTLATRVSLGAEATYRLLLVPSAGLYLTLGAGVVGGADAFSERRFQVTADSTSPTGYAASALDTSSVRPFVRPTFSIGLISARAVEVRYEFQLDVMNPAMSTHQIALEFRY